jgi:hypothetical protein
MIWYDMIMIMIMIMMMTWLWYDMMWLWLWLWFWLWYDYDTIWLWLWLWLWLWHALRGRLNIEWWSMSVYYISLLHFLIYLFICSFNCSTETCLLHTAEFTLTIGSPGRRWRRPGQGFEPGQSCAAQKTTSLLSLVHGGLACRIYIFLPWCSTVLYCIVVYCSAVYCQL